MNATKIKPGYKFYAALLSHDDTGVALLTCTVTRVTTSRCYFIVKYDRKTGSRGLRGGNFDGMHSKTGPYISLNHRFVRQDTPWKAYEELRLITAAEHELISERRDTLLAQLENIKAMMEAFA